MKASLVLIVAAALAACATSGPPASAPVTETVPSAAATAVPGATSEADVGQDPAALEQDDPYGASFWASSEHVPQDASESWDDLICKRAGVTGSRQVTRRCHTRWEWAQMEAAAAETMRDIESKPQPILD